MQALINLIKRTQSLTVDDMIRHLSEQREFTDLIIELNTKKQLFEQGIDSAGRRLSDVGGDYSPITIMTARKKGKPKKSFSDINLNDTGAFYESFKVFYDNGNLVISADTLKTDEYGNVTDLISEWGQNILGLTQESLSILRGKALQILIPYVRKRLLNA